MKKYFVSTIGLLLVLMNCLTLYAADQRVVKVGAFNYYPGIFKDIDGAVKGFYVDAMADIAQKENIRFEYLYGSWSEGLERIKSGEVDLLTSVAYTPERAEFLDYAKTPLLTVWGELYVPLSSDIDGILAVQGKKIAVMKNDFNARYFIELVKKFDITCEFIEMPGFEDVFNAVATKKVDAGVVSSTFGIAKHKEFGLRSTGVVFNPFDIFFAVAKGKNSDLLLMLDKHLKGWRNQSESVYSEARRKWLHGSDNVIKVTPRWLLPTFAVIAFLSLCFFVFIVILKKQVRSKTLSVVEAAEQYRSVAHELRLSEERSRLIMETVAVIPWEFNIPKNSWTYVGPQVKELMGYAPEEWTDLEWWLEIIHPEDKTWVPACCADWTSRGEEHSMEYRLRTKDGSFIWVNDLVTVEMLDGKPHIMRGVIIDINARKQSEELLKNALRDMPIAVAMSDNQQVITFLNRRFVELFGYTEDDIKTAADWWYIAYPDEQYRLSVMDTWGRAVEKAVNEGTYVEKGEYSVTCKDGTTRIVEASGVPLGTSLLITFNDVTEQRAAEKERLHLENQLHQAQKIESVGRLAGGVAHDFNNMLSVIFGHAELGLMQLDPAHPVCADLKEISKTAERSADLTRQLLTFARKQTVMPKIIDLNDTITNMLKMLQRLIGEDIHLTWQPSPELCQIKMDPSQIDQLLANLCVNARDAIEDTGRITIETGTCIIDADYCAANPEATPGDYVRLVVSDSGKGMDRETMTHIFEPFYTTKEMGKGTGLGLATVYGAVKQNNGFINIYSEPGKGTTFSIHLPRETDTGTARRAQADAEIAVPRGQETILLVEDEAAILNIASLMLEKQGYTVLKADTPGEALSLAREHVGQIDLLMTDVIMPEMNGRDLARNILALHPGIKRLFMSGYTADVIAQHGVLDAGVHFIQKPFSLPNMAAKVREVLDGNS